MPNLRSAMQLRFYRSLAARRDGDAHLELLLAAAENHAARRRDIAEVAAPGERDVTVVHQAVVGRIDVDPADGRAPYRDPRVRGVGADQARSAGRRHGKEIAA